jgi:hypothetical protein
VKCDSLAAARLFIMARGRGGENHMEDTLALAILLEEFARAGYRKGVEDTVQAKELPATAEGWY